MFVFVVESFVKYFTGISRRTGRRFLRRRIRLPVTETVFIEIVRQKEVSVKLEYYIKVLVNYVDFIATI